jgi:hypothetical protein
MRFNPDDEAIIDALKVRLGVARRADVVRYAVREAALRRDLRVGGVATAVAAARRWKERGFDGDRIARGVRRYLGVNVSARTVVAWLAESS